MTDACEPRSLTKYALPPQPIYAQAQYQRRMLLFLFSSQRACDSNPCLISPDWWTSSGKSKWYVVSGARFFENALSVWFQVRMANNFNVYSNDSLIKAVAQCLNEEGYLAIRSNGVSDAMPISSTLRYKLFFLGSRSETTSSPKTPKKPNLMKNLLSGASGHLKSYTILLLGSWEAPNVSKRLKSIAKDWCRIWTVVPDVILCKICLIRQSIG